MIREGLSLLTAIVAITLLTSASSLAAGTPATNCVSKTEMAEIARDFPQFRNLASADYCLDGSLTANLIESLMFMRKTRFETIMPASSDELFSGRFANGWYDYFQQRIDELDIQSSCQKGVGAYVYMWGNTMYVCPMLLSANFTSLDRASVMMHEARHIDGYPHVTCNRGPRTGLQGACDNKIADGGSYAVSVETYAQIGRYAPDLHPAFRAYAKAAAVTYADEAFDTPTKIERNSQFVFMTKDLAFHSLDPSRGLTIQDLGSAPELGRIVMRAQFMILFPDNKSSPARYLFARNEGEIAQQAGDIASEYNGQSPSDRARLVDVHIGGQWAARVYNDRVRVACDPRSDSTSDVSLNGETPKAFLYPNGYDRGAKTAQLEMASGKIFDLTCSGGSPQLRASSVKLDRLFKKLYKAGNETIGLGDDGKLYRVQNGVSQVLSTAFDGQIYDLAPSTSTRFFDGSLIN